MPVQIRGGSPEAVAYALLMQHMANERLKRGADWQPSREKLLSAYVEFLTAVKSGGMRALASFPVAALEQTFQPEIAPLPLEPEEPSQNRRVRAARALSRVRGADALLDDDDEFDC